MNDAATSTTYRMLTIARQMQSGPCGLRLAHTAAMGLLDEPLYGRERERLEQLLRGIERRLARLSVTELVLRDRMSGFRIFLALRDGVVIGAMGSSPARYLGLTEAEARHKARYSQKT